MYSLSATAAASRAPASRHGGVAWQGPHDDRGALVSTATMPPVTSSVIAASICAIVFALPPYRSSRDVGEFGAGSSMGFGCLVR